MKRCVKCRKMRERGEYYDNPSTSDGKHTVCSHCFRRWRREKHMAESEGLTPIPLRSHTPWHPGGLYSMEQLEEVDWEPEDNDGEGSEDSGEVVGESGAG